MTKSGNLVPSGIVAFEEEEEEEVPPCELPIHPIQNMIVDAAYPIGP